MNYTYMLRCSDGTLYTGWTNNLEKRVSTHNKGKGGKYTRCRVPVELVYYECFDTKEEAMSREAAIKQLLFPPHMRCTHLQQRVRIIYRKTKANNSPFSFRGDSPASEHLTHKILLRYYLFFPANRIIGY